MGIKVEGETSYGDLVEGPFAVNLTHPLKPGVTAEGRARVILGGPVGSVERIHRSLEEIRGLEPEITWSDYRQRAGEIFRANGLQRVDH